MVTEITNTLGGMSKKDDIRSSFTAKGGLQVI